MPAASATPTEVGARAPVEFRFEVLPVHAALCHTEKLLAFGGSGSDETRLETPHPAGLFDPVAGAVETVEQELASDPFCAGHAFPADTRLLLAEGTHRDDGGTDLPVLPRLPPFRGLEQ